MKPRTRNKIVRPRLLALLAALFLVLAVLLLFLYDIGRKGAGVISWEFLTKAPRKGMTDGGIFPAILGTFLVTVITVLLAVPLGMSAPST